MIQFFVFAIFIFFTHDTLTNNIPSQKNCDSDPIIELIYPGFKQAFDSHAIVEYHATQLKKQKPEHDFLTMMIYLELKQRLPELLLGRVDKMTMATSVEGRVPFLDHKLVEYSLAMPSRYKYHNGVTKHILKKTAESILPHDVIYRKKMGFAAPTKRWFKEGKYFKSYFLDQLQSNQKEWQSFIDIAHVKKLYMKNNTEEYDYSLQLWTIQNLIVSI